MIDAVTAALYGSAGLREIDAAAIAGGIPGAELMRRAAAAAWREARQRWPTARRIAVCCGRGNNGGDGYALALLARAEGCEVRVFQLGEPPSGASAGPAVAAWIAAGGVIDRAASPADFAQAQPELVVDALFGIGLTRPVEGLAAEWIAAINAHPAPVLALDLPSGLDADTGQVHGAAVRADLSLSFIGHKLGAWTGTGPSICGTRVLDGLAVPAAAYAGVQPLARFITAADVLQALPRRLRHAHKGHHGHVLVVGGAPGMAGAALLAARAALRGGAGWVSLATHPEHAAALVAAQPEVMVQAVTTAEALRPLLARATVVVVGPGLGAADWGLPLWEAVLASGRPLVVDADGLNALAQRPQSLGGAVITPHPGEAARLLGLKSAAEVEADRCGAARRLQARYQAVSVLKGAGSLVADGRQLRLCPTGNPGMAVGGMGDVLAGLIGALMAQGLDPATAAAVGVRAHADAADTVAALRGERGLLPSDLLEALQGPLNPEMSR
jgi:ADP-dependent NAD(P)H-hydrate dehydratase / NAD(P)H-hydrate epimerase